MKLQFSQCLEPKIPDPVLLIKNKILGEDEIESLCDFLDSFKVDQEIDQV